MLADSEVSWRESVERPEGPGGSAVPRLDVSGAVGRLLTIQTFGTKRLTGHVAFRELERELYRLAGTTRPRARF